MNRRKFIRAFAGAVATVAIGLKLSQGMPEMLKESKILFASPDVESSLRFKATMRFSPPYTDWRAVYGSPG